MYSAFISTNGNIVVQATEFKFEAGQVPTKPILSYCRKDDPQFDEFLQFCKDSGWM